MTTFAVPDLHGRYDLLDEALARIERKTAAGTVVFLGDYVDRGPDSRPVVERLMAGPPAGWEWVCLKGNHEDMMATSIQQGDLNLWLSNGGHATLESYGGKVPANHLAWCAVRPALHTDTHRIFVHACVDPWLSLDEQDPWHMMWRRYPPGEDVRYPGYHIVHGHTPNPDGPELLAGRTNLDCMAFGTDRLAVGVFADDEPGGPAEILEVQGSRG